MSSIRCCIIGATFILANANGLEAVADFVSFGASGSISIQGGLHTRPLAFQNEAVPVFNSQPQEFSFAGDDSYYDGFGTYAVSVNASTSFHGDNNSYRIGISSLELRLASPGRADGELIPWARIGVSLNANGSNAWVEGPLYPDLIRAVGPRLLVGVHLAPGHRVSVSAGYFGDLAAIGGAPSRVYETNDVVWTLDGPGDFVLSKDLEVLLHEDSDWFQPPLYYHDTLWPTSMDFGIEFMIEDIAGALGSQSWITLGPQQALSPQGSSGGTPFPDLVGLSFGLAARLASDLNSDGSVDAVDAGIMFASWGNVPPGNVADLNGDVLIDAGDAGIMFSEWTGDAGRTSVPEPSTSFLVTSLLLGSFSVRRNVRES